MKKNIFFGKQTVRQASAILVLVSILAKFAGFFRETVTAREFGITADYDLFLIIFIIPASISITINYTISYALTPFYQKLCVEFGHQQARDFVKLFFCLGLIFFLLFSGIIAFFADFFVPLLTLTNSSVAHNLAVQLLSTLIWLLPLYFSVAVLQTLLQADHFFFSSSIGPLIQNVVIISVLLMFSGTGVVSLAYGWCLGLLSWFFWLVFTYLYTQKKSVVDLTSSTKQSSLPLLGVFLISGFQIACIEIWPQLYVYFDRVAAQWFHLLHGRIAALSYATTLYTMVLSIFAMSIGRAIFPFLSAQVANSNREGQQRLLFNGIRWMLLVSLPVAGGLYALSHEVVELVYQRGHFDGTATEATARVLKIFCIGLPFDSVYAVLVGFFYALRDYRSLMTVSFSSIIIKILAGIFLTKTYGYIGLALATVLAVIWKAMLMTAKLSRHNLAFVRTPETYSLLWKSFFAILLSVLCINAVSFLFSLQLFQEINLQLLNFIVVCVSFGLLFVVYGGMLVVSGVPEAKIIFEKLKRLVLGGQQG